jgi:hypothetical protein
MAGSQGSVPAGWECPPGRRRAGSRRPFSGIRHGVVCHRSRRRTCCQDVQRVRSVSESVCSDVYALLGTSTMADRSRCTMTSTHHRPTMGLRGHRHLCLAAPSIPPFIPGHFLCRYTDNQAAIHSTCRLRPLTIPIRHHCLPIHHTMCKTRCFRILRGRRGAPSRVETAPRRARRT